jgi:hypothetical protein
MKTHLPDYIPVDAVAEPAIDYAWNDWDPFEPLGEPEELTKSILRQVSNRGITAFALGCAEWVVARLSRSLRETVVHEYLDAFWYYLLGGSDIPPPATNDEDWEGAVLGPINLALMTVLNTIYLSEDGPPVQNGALAAQIAMHVMPIPMRDAFTAWQAAALQRLPSVCHREPEAPDGDCVPRVVLDPRVELGTIHAPAAVKHELAQIAISGNRFLRSSLASD